MQSRCYPVQLMSGLEVMPLIVVIRTMCLLVVKRTLKTFPWQTRYYIISNLLLHTTALYEFPKMSVGAYVLGWVVKPGTELQVHWISTKNGKKNDTSFGMTSINFHQAPPKATLTWKSYVHSCQVFLQFREQTCITKLQALKSWVGTWEWGYQVQGHPIIAPGQDYIES